MNDSPFCTASPCTHGHFVTKGSRPSAELAGSDSRLASGGDATVNSLPTFRSRAGRQISERRQ